MVHEVGHIRDVHAHLQVAVRQPANVQGIVDILAPGRVNGHDTQVSDIPSASTVGFGDLPIRRWQASHDGGRKLARRDVVLQ